MNIQKIEITKLKPAEYNPRKDLKPEDEEYQKIKRSITEFGYVAPVIVNSDMTVIGGHQRLKVLKKLGYNEVECVVVDLNKNKEKALNIALNKISGDWDNSKLEELLAELKETDIDLDITGFSFDEVDNILKDITGSKEDDFDIQQALDEIDEPITKTGDIWILGKHRLMCGDSTIIDNVYKLTNKEKVKVLFTDPPYNMAFNGRSGNFDVIKNDDLDKKEFEIFIDKFLNILTKVIMPEAYYICCNWCFYGILQLRLNPKACIVWAKNNFGLGKGYRHQHEFILFDGYIKENIKNETMNLILYAEGLNDIVFDEDNTLKTLKRKYLFEYLVSSLDYEDFLEIKDYLYSLKKVNFTISEFKKVINERGISYGR